ncbi:MAG TPA: WHG domain-containing protein [Rhizomicrobium sp.]
MARRSDHSRDELAAMVVGGARAIAQKKGWRGVSMRGIAARIGYAPGSIYNAVGDIDDVLLRVNADTLTRLLTALEEAAAHAQPGVDGALAIANAYVTFVMAHPKLWAALIERSPPVPAPDWYAEPRARLVEVVAHVIAPTFPDAAERRRAVLALWASLQGAASLAVGGNLAFAGGDPHEIARAIVRRYLSGRED